ncbi:MAG: hypothetical protein NC082_07755 [Clostridiales bacterium]|nr:hypothetical protein [Clostridiales bacterium]
MIDSQQSAILSTIENFRSQAIGKPTDTSRNYLKAIACFESWASTYHYADQIPSRCSIADWFAGMIARRLSLKTALHYLDIVAALFSAGDITGDTGTKTAPRPTTTHQELFKTIKKDIRSVAAATPSLTSGINIANLPSLHLFLRQPLTRGSREIELARDLLLCSLAMQAMPMHQVARLKTARLADNPSPMVRHLVQRHSSPRRRYLFELGQSQLTDRQLDTRVATLMANLFRLRGIPLVRTIDNTIATLWALTALSDGVPASDIATILPTLDLPLITIARQRDPATLARPINEATPACSDNRLATISDTVIAHLLDTPPQWFVMKLRPRVDYTRLTDRLATLNSTTRHTVDQLPELFYPHQEIARRIGRRLVYDRQPIIRDIVFFRLRRTDIYPLFLHIGDLAWCYTASRRPGSDYQAIPNSQFATFQQAIGQFTPGTDIYPAGTITIQEGDRVEIIGGDLKGHTATYERQLTDPDTRRIIYRLRLIGDNSIEWVVNIDHRLVATL